MVTQLVTPCNPLPTGDRLSPEECIAEFGKTIAKTIAIIAITIAIIAIGTKKAPTPGSKFKIVDSKT